MLREREREEGGERGRAREGESERQRARARARERERERERGDKHKAGQVDSVNGSKTHGKTRLRGQQTYTPESTSFLKVTFFFLDDSPPSACSSFSPFCRKECTSPPQLPETGLIFRHWVVVRLVHHLGCRPSYVTPFTKVSPKK